MSDAGDAADADDDAGDASDALDRRRTDDVENDEKETRKRNGGGRGRPTMTSSQCDVIKGPRLSWHWGAGPIGVVFSLFFASFCFFFFFFLLFAFASYSGDVSIDFFVSRRRVLA